MHCPTHGLTANTYTVDGRTYCAVLHPEAVDTGDTCDQRMMEPCPEGCTCATCRYVAAVNRGGAKL